jgi:hypothetical protein
MLGEMRVHHQWRLIVPEPAACKKSRLYFALSRRRSLHNQGQGFTASSSHRPPRQNLYFQSHLAAVFPPPRAPPGCIEGRCDIPHSICSNHVAMSPSFPNACNAHLVVLARPAQMCYAFSTAALGRSPAANFNMVGEMDGAIPGVYYPATSHTRNDKADPSPKTPTLASKALYSDTNCRFFSWYHSRPTGLLQTRRAASFHAVGSCALLY